MKFALVNNKKIEAKKGLNGICPACGQPVIAKCGARKINHWAHKSKVSCDKWWESETEWHRNWKNSFPLEWQEKIFTDRTTNENHIADVCTVQGLVIEFQHSHMKPEERISRENFYKNMLWVVDGTRLKNDYKRLINGLTLLRQIGQGIFCIHSANKIFPKNWLNSPVPVIFDFMGTEHLTNNQDLRNYLYCLIPQKLNNESIVIFCSREQFIQTCKDDNITAYFKNLTENIIKTQQLLQKQANMVVMPRVSYTRPRYYSRRHRRF